MTKKLLVAILAVGATVQVSTSAIAAPGPDLTVGVTYAAGPLKGKPVGIAVKQSADIPLNNMAYSVMGETKGQTELKMVVNWSYYCARQGVNEKPWLTTENKTYSGLSIAGGAIHRRFIDVSAAEVEKYVCPKHSGDIGISTYLYSARVHIVVSGRLQGEMHEQGIDFVWKKP